MMGPSGSSQSNVWNPIQNFELKIQQNDPESSESGVNYELLLIQQNDPELGVRQDNRSRATKAFKWIVRHPFLAAAATIGLVGVASGGFYGLTLLGAASPVATALSGRNATTTEASTTKGSTTKGSNFIARDMVIN